MGFGAPVEADAAGDATGRRVGLMRRVRGDEELEALVKVGERPEVALLHPLSGLREGIPQAEIAALRIQNDRPVVAHDVVEHVMLDHVPE